MKLVIFAVLTLIQIAAASASDASAVASGVKSMVPSYELVQTANGVPVYYFKSPNVPLFEVHIVFGQGSDWDPAGKSGLGMFASNMIKRGVPGLDEDALSRRLDDLAGGIDVSVDEERIGISAYGLNERAPEIIDLLFKQLTQPTFPDAPFQRLKSNHLDNIRQLSDSPGGLASHVIEGLIFNGTRKARPGSGLQKDVQKLRLEDLKSYYPRLVRTDQMRVLVIGGRDRAELLDGLLKRIEAMACSACGQQRLPLRSWEFPQWRVPKGAALVLERPGISEAHVRMGFAGPGRKVPEFYDLRVAETILSGHFASRLNMVIREKLNLTYGISGGYGFGPTVGSFVISSSTRNEKVGELIFQTSKLLREFVNGEISEGDVQIAKDYLTGSFPLSLQNIYVIASSFFNGLLYGLQPSFLDDYPKRINEVTLTSLKSAVRKHFRLNDMHTLVVGSSRDIAPRLAERKIKYIVRSPRLYL